MTSGAHIIHAHILASEISWNYDLNRWKSRVYLLQHWKTQTGLGPWAGKEAWLRACTHSWHLGMGCSQVGHLGLALSALFGELFLCMPHYLEML